MSHIFHSGSLHHLSYFCLSLDRQWRWREQWPVSSRCWNMSSGKGARADLRTRSCWAPWGSRWARVHPLRRESTAQTFTHPIRQTRTCSNTHPHTHTHTPSFASHMHTLRNQNKSHDVNVFCVRADGSVSVSLCVSRLFVSHRESRPWRSVWTVCVRRMQTCVIALPPYTPGSHCKTNTTNTRANRCWHTHARYMLPNNMQVVTRKLTLKPMNTN